MPTFFKVIKDHVDSEGRLWDAGSVRQISDKQSALASELKLVSFVEEISEGEAKKIAKAAKNTGEAAQVEQTLAPEEPTVSADLIKMAEDLSTSETAAADETAADETTIEKAFE